MKFKSGQRRRAHEYEPAIVKYWKDNQTFQKSVELRDPANSYVFYDGPPFITGAPHYGTLLSSIIKDAVPRYQTMLGKRVERRWGWDCHGLPAENFVEKQLGITDRRQIIADPEQKAPLDKDGNPLSTISLEKYIETARDSMIANSETWEGVVDRVGRWVEFKGAYRTMNREYMESVWWAFKQLYQAGRIYEGEKVLMYDTKFATPVSKAEVTMDNDAYQTVTDPSVYVKFQLTAESAEQLGVPADTAVLAWTTTPWTLPANIILAVNTGMKYALVESGDDQLIVAVDCLKTTFRDDKNQPADYKIVRKFAGKDLVGLTYQPLATGSTWPTGDEQAAKIHRIYAADFVTAESGTGIVHVAPAYGEDDFGLCQQIGIKAFHVIDDNGYYFDSIYTGREVWANNKFIAKDLKERGIVWRIVYIQHEYPFNPRSKQRIMYRAIPSWFFDIQNSKPLLLDQNENINWFPEHLKHGRFAKNIDQAPDWNLSRDRFWAAAMPVWKGDKGGIIVVGSYDELEKLSGERLDDYHRPWVDAVKIYADKLDADTKTEYGMQDGEVYTRINKVLDCWFESGSMPFAQLHYPFENKEKFERNYPADFIVEYIGQVRAWFYYVHAVNTSLASIGAFGEGRAKLGGHMNAYRNVITTGVVAGNDGRKMSKSLGNYTDPNILMDQYSADSLRFLLLSSPLLNGEDFALLDKDVSDVARKLAMIWNMYDFFTMYAEVDGWEYDADNGVPTINLTKLANPLDRWVVSRVHQLTEHIKACMDKYDIATALDEVLPFIDDASNWFVRRSRRRFWKSDDDGDKEQAYQTLHYVLVRLAIVLAPFTPFLSEELYQKLVGGESVHLLNWPMDNPVDNTVLCDMARTRSLINSGLMLRMSRNDGYGQIKIRQPLAFASYTGERLDGYYEQIMQDELNVKRINWVEKLDRYRVSGVTAEDGKPEVWVELNKELTDELRYEGLSREVIRVVQKARKDAGLNVDDRIKLSLVSTDADITTAITKWGETIIAETLATELVDKLDKVAFETTAKIGKAEMTIALIKA
ncbi:MAG: isoleucine--tRNA ligase [Candidatus Saccharibacteria bacterium]|nr:isoleucine--tRNA ligase [Candidatus Saccharibacteria bacterium]